VDDLNERAGDVLDVDNGTKQSQRRLEGRRQHRRTYSISSDEIDANAHLTAANHIERVVDDIVGTGSASGANEPVVA
jgi:hypothetical protein